VADFLKQVLPPSSSTSDASHSGTQAELGPATPYIKSEPPSAPAKPHIATPIPSTSSDVIYQTSTPPPPSIVKGDDDEDGDDVGAKPHVLEFGAKTLGELASPYVSPYVYESKRRFLDTEYGIRRVDDEYMIGDSRVSVDRDGNIHIKKVEFPATKGLWELLTRKKVNKKSVTSNDLKQYKTILEMTNAHFEGYDPTLISALPKVSSLGMIIRSYFPQAHVKLALKPHYAASGYRTWSPCCGGCTPNLLHRQHFPVYTSFMRQLDAPLTVNSLHRQHLPAYTSFERLLDMSLPVSGKRQAR